MLADNKVPASGHHGIIRVRATGFWSTDWSLTVLLALLVGNIFVLPLAEFATWGRLASRSILSLVIISGAIATIRDPRLVLVVVLLTFGSLGVGFGDLERSNLYLHLFNDLYSIAFIGFLAVLILRQVLRTGPITWRRVEGSVAIYLLLGLLWSVCYEMTELVRPGSFRIAQNAPAGLPQLAYFSFTTLTTLGFGDIVPVHPLARSLAMLEGLVGQLFPVILIARLVTMEIEHQRKNRPG
ncbi:MAG TPA: potassium channel family protein [Candidatus Binataceae bacterium]|nr:potassium channel family protein [Candidatus Binataceae bacterium]